jgi:hypothetical protein
MPRRGCGQTDRTAYETVDPRPPVDGLALQTNKGRGRYTGAWRAPKVLRGYGVEAEGQRATTFVPVMEATRTGPDAVCARRRPSVHRREITQAAQGRLLADGAPWSWNRVPLLGQA